MARPELTRVPEFYHNYINQVPDDNLKAALENSGSNLIFFLNKIPAEKHEFAYEDGKWTIKEILQHIIDAERVFSYRALRFARKDETPLPGFNENVFAANANANSRNWKDLVEEFSVVMNATELLFASFNEEQLEANGISNNHSIYVLGIGFICAGHRIHHQHIIQSKYL